MACYEYWIWNLFEFSDLQLFAITMGRRVVPHAVQGRRAPSNQIPDVLSMLFHKFVKLLMDFTLFRLVVLEVLSNFWASLESQICSCKRNGDASRRQVQLFPRSEWVSPSNSSPFTVWNQVPSVPIYRSGHGGNGTTAPLGIKTTCKISQFMVANRLRVAMKKLSFQLAKDHEAQIGPRVFFSTFEEVIWEFSFALLYLSFDPAWNIRFTIWSIKLFIV